MRILGLFLAIALMSVSAQADQCSYVTKDFAQKTMNLLNDRIGSDDLVKSWCEPCGETKAQAKDKKAEVIKSVQIAHAGYEDYYEISINGRSVDMAYTFIADINLAVYINAKTGLKAEQAGKACNLSGVSETL